MTDIRMADEATSRTMEHIRVYGFSTIVVNDDASTACVRCGHDKHHTHTHGPLFAYSVGLWMTAKAPEVIVTGVPRDDLTSLVRWYAERVLHGETFVEGELYQDFFTTQPAQFRAVRPVKKPELGEACRLYHGTQFPAVQLIVPDTAGFWPWQRECAPGLTQAQKLLCYPPKRSNHV